ncbi:MAG TPA: alpha/beta fold hydrolase [Terriglobia bacterium]|nr:alpha/beta fold hydrolase [Terriglobia bacterium]
MRGFLHRPETSSGEALVLTHGAGSNCQAPMLQAVAVALAEAGFTVLRCDLPYRQERPYGPPSPGGSARDREGLRRAVQALKELNPPGSLKRMFLGGHSYGGRQASMLAAADPGLILGLLLLSYPLHPPRKPDQLRTAHFPQLRTRALFVHGSRDLFGTLEEMRSALALIPATTSLVPIENAGHDLGFGRGRTHSSDAQGRWIRPVTAAFQSFIGK